MNWKMPLAISDRIPIIDIAGLTARDEPLVEENRQMAKTVFGHKVTDGKLTVSYYDNDSYFEGSWSASVTKEQILRWSLEGVWQRASDKFGAVKVPETKKTLMLAFIKDVLAHGEEPKADKMNRQEIAARAAIQGALDALARMPQGIRTKVQRDVIADLGKQYGQELVNRIFSGCS